jgi:hypothetical protein
MEKKTGHCVAPAGPCYVCGSHDVEGRSLFCESCEERIAIMQEGGDKRPLAIIIYSIRKTRLESEKVRDAAGIPSPQTGGSARATGGS